jgi:hypothetical protein
VDAGSIPRTAFYLHPGKAGLIYITSGDPPSRCLYSILLFHTLVSEGKDKSHGAVEPTRVGQNFAKQQGIRQRRCCLAAGAAVGGGAGLASLAGGDG